MILNFFALLKEISWADLVDIGAASLLLWMAMQGLRTARARATGAGLLVLGGFYLLARHLQLALTSWLLQGIAALFLLIVVVVFQDEIRTFFEQVPRFFSRRRRLPPPLYIAEVLAEALSDFAHRHWGALIVLPGKAPLGALIKGGIPLDGYLSKPLLLSLFDPGSPGHDGAALVEGRRIARFACHLPLSVDVSKFKGRGTRHAAALGLSERCDALVLVVSEETGSISVAHRGTLQTLPHAGEVTDVLSRHLTRHAEPVGRVGLGRTLLRRAGVGGLAALLLSLVLWLALVPGSVVGTETFKVPLSILNVPPGYLVEEVVPAEIDVTLSGPRRALILFDPRRISIPLDATLATAGRRTFTVTSGQVSAPPGLEVVALTPNQVRISVRTTPAPRP